MRIKLGLVAIALFVAACANESNPLPGGGEPTTGKPEPATPDPGAQQGGGGEQGGGEKGGETEKPPEKAAPLAQSISVGEVAVFQGVKVSVEKNAAKVSTRTAPVVASREALVRLYVTPGAGFAGKSLTGELRISNRGTEQVFKDTKTISKASTDDALTSTFNFEV